MKFRPAFVIIFVLSVFMLNACDQKDQIQSPDEEITSTPQNGDHPVIPEWPPENKKPAKINYADDFLAKNYYLVMDGSGSMNEEKCSGNLTKSEASKVAAIEFIQRISPEANVGYFAFDSTGIRERVPIAANTSKQKKRIKGEIQKTKADSSTPLTSALGGGYYALQTQGYRQQGYGEYHLVVLTDGEANSREKLAKNVSIILNISPVVIHTIGFCIENHVLNQPGKTRYYAANSPESLTQAFSEVLAESSDTDDGDF